MGRHSPGKAYGQWCKKLTWSYQIGWTVDFYYASSRLRHPRSFVRNTERANAKRFCKKYNLDWNAHDNDK